MVQAAGDWWLQTREVPRERLVEDLCELLTRGWVDPRLSNPRPPDRG